MFLAYDANFNNAPAYVEERIEKKTEMQVGAMIQSMSLEEKIGQVFIGIIYGKKLDDRSKSFIEKTKIGNFVLFNWANGLDDKEQVKKLTNDIRSFVKEKLKLIPFIAVDEEGGRVSRLIGEFPSFPSNRKVAQSEDLSFAFEIDRKIGKEMKEVGINLNFAPVVDICGDSNFWMFDRCYSGDPDNVIFYARKMIEGLHAEGILVTLKHFPGHGAVNVNSHYKLPFVDKPLEALEKIELKPFITLKDETDCIMSAHIIFPELDDKNCATASKHILTDMLKKKYGFKGLIISDSLAMKAIVPNQRNIEETAYGVSEAAIKVFNAGCDCLIISEMEWADCDMKGNPVKNIKLFEKVIDTFKKAVEEGKISEKRLNASLTKILRLKLKASF